MFSRTAKSVVKSFGSRRIHIGEKNFTIVVISGVGEISQTLSQLLKNSMKLNALALYNVTAVNRFLSNYNFYDEQFEPVPSRLRMTEKNSFLGENICSNAVINNTKQTVNNNHQGDTRKNQTEKLVEALCRLPIAEGVPVNNLLIPIEALMLKAGNTCSRMRPYARVLGERDSSNMKIWQRDYATVAICKWFPDLIYPSFQKYDPGFIPEAKILKKHQLIKKTRDIRHSSCSAPVTEENNHQSLPASLLNHDEKSMKKFKNITTFSNTEACCRAVKELTNLISIALNNQSKLLREIYGRIRFCSSLLNFINHTCANNREIVALNHNNKTLIDDTLNVVEQKNWIQRTCSKIKSILPDLQAKIRLHSATTSDSYCLENIFAVNQEIPLSDIISNSAILFAEDHKDQKPKAEKIGICQKIQEFCMRNKFLKKKENRDDFCKNRKKKRSCKTKETMEERDQTREEICKKKRIDCSESKKRTKCEKQDVISDKRIKDSYDKESVRSCRKTREQKAQEELSKQKKDDICKTKEDLEQEQTYYKLHDASPCRQKEKDEICKTKEDFRSEQSLLKQEQTCYKLHDASSCRQEEKEQKKDEICKTKKDFRSKQSLLKQEQTCYKLHDADPCRQEKKEEQTFYELYDTTRCKAKKKEEIKQKEIKKPDCTEIKKVEPCDKKPCPPVEKRREISSSSMKSAIKIEGGNSIESNQMKFKRSSLSIVNSSQQFMGINFIKNFQQDTNSAINHKNYLDFSFLHQYFATNLRCDEPEFEKIQLPYSSDDYFPQGEEYEEEIGREDYQLGKKIPSKKPSDSDEYDNFKPVILMFENNKCVNESPLTKFITRVYFSNIEGLIEADRTISMSQRISNKDAIEKLQTLIEKEGGGPRSLVRDYREIMKKYSKILHDLIHKNQQAISGRDLRLGEPDCGEDLPDEPKRNPCDPPPGPCQPAQPPGYPSKPKPKRKPFCVRCPPKKPCKEEKC
ncbi:hypothetical protein P5V15_004892 [Pogonomyrmex californicus]